MNSNTGTDFNVPVSSTTPNTPDVSSSPTPTLTASATASLPTGSASPANYAECAPRYAQLIIDLNLAGGIDPADAARWSGWAQEAAELANSGDLAGAYALCEQTVVEMEQALGG